MLFHVGMLEKAVFFSEYNNINITGEISKSVRPAAKSDIHNCLGRYFEYDNIGSCFKCMEKTKTQQNMYVFFMHFQITSSIKIPVLCIYFPLSPVL